MLVKELHLLKTALFNQAVVDGEIPLRDGVIRLVDEAIFKKIPLVRETGFYVMGQASAYRVTPGEGRGGGAFLLYLDKGSWERKGPPYVFVCLFVRLLVLLCLFFVFSWTSR